jgi:CRP/FNR family transcriptional regulator, cyclic AMP receptor protein
MSRLGGAKSVRKMTKSPSRTGLAQTRARLESSEFSEVLGAALDERVLGAFRTVRLTRDQVYQTRGCPVTGVAIVAKGFLRISLSSPRGKRHVLRHLGPGQVFNLLPVVDGGAGIHDAEAGTDTELLVLPKGTFLELLRSNPAVAGATQRVLHARMRLLYDGLADAMLLNLSQRTARTLLDVVGAFGRPAGASGELGVTLSQGEFADMLGNARPVVNRALRKLQRDGVIELGYQRIVVLQMQALRQAAGL